MRNIFKSLNKKDYFLIFISTLLIIFQVWLDLKLPEYMSEITRLVQTEGSLIKDILTQGFYMILCAFGSLISAFIVGYLISSISATFSKNLRKKLFEKVETFSMKELKKFSDSSLITRTTNDITNIQMFIAMGMQLLIKAPITAVWAICKILNKGWQWSLITFGAVIILLTTVSIIMIIVIPKFKKMQKLIDNINSLTKENLEGSRVIRAFNAEKYQEDKFEVGNSLLTNNQMFTQKVMALMSPFMYLLMNTLTICIYAVGAHLLNINGMSQRLDIFSNMVVFSSYAMQVIMSFLMLAMIYIMYPRASVSYNRINEVLKEKSNVIDGKFSKKTKETGKLEFKNVSFKYPGADDYVIKNISFVINKGQTLAVIGSTGSGKSTIVNLIMRFYDDYEGIILLDDVDIRDYKLTTLYKKLGYVPQKPVLFSGTVTYNISYGHKYMNNKKILEASKIAMADDFINNMPKKYKSEITQDGTNISGGQKQRIAIARAVVNNPEIFIFDDSFSALDYKTDYKVRNNIKNKFNEKTNIIIAQRIGTIINADKIMVLDNGKIVGYDTHKKLLKKCKVYKEIALSQLSKEELSNEK